VGYTTTFDGLIHCYRVESAMAGQFLKAIYLDENADAALAAFADWLTDQGDPRGEQIAELSSAVEEDLAVFWRLFALQAEHAEYLKQFAYTRRMKRNAKQARLLPDPVREVVGLPLGTEGAYFVGGLGFRGQEDDASVIDHNKPPRGQPGLWCQWIPNEDGTAIVWDGVEKFYDYVRWLEYLIEHFLTPWGYLLNGRVDWQGEDRGDVGTILVRDNRVEPGPAMD
jgi:uncharacterized protein (TIGR02996 family)